MHVRNAISRSLESHGLGHLPQELPPNQEDPVRLYLLDSPIADVIKAVLIPSDRGDETLCSIGASELRSSCVRSGRSSAADSHISRTTDHPTEQEHKVGTKDQSTPNPRQFA